MGRRIRSEQDAEDMFDRPKDSLKKKIAKKLARYCFVAICGLVGASVSFFYIQPVVEAAAHTTKAKYLEYKYALADYLDVVRIDTKIVEVEQAKIDELIIVYSKKWGLEPIVLKAVIDKESEYRTGRHRFEQSWKDQYRGKPGFEREPWMNDDEYDDYFRSFGLTQVGYGLWRRFCDLNSPDELYNVGKSFDCTLKIMKACLKEHKHLENGVRIEICFKKYNGSGPKAEAYAKDMLVRLVGFSVDDKKIMMDDEDREVIDHNTGAIIEEAKVQPVPVKEVINTKPKKKPIVAVKSTTKSTEQEINCNIGGKLEKCVMVEIDGGTVVRKKS